MARGLADFSASELRALRMNLSARPGAVAMTAEELARAVGTTKAQILAYENGHRVPDPPRVRALARALGVRPSALMNPQGPASWDIADVRRACGLRARDVVDALGVSPKNYRRFENEGIVPSRRPCFLDEVAALFGIARATLERAVNRTPAARGRQERAAELIGVLAERYVPAPGPWKGPAPDDPALVELAAAYGRPVPRTRRVLAYELGELRQTHVRAERERVIADFDTDRDRQANARLALLRWKQVYDRELGRIVPRMEQFHRNAQPSTFWQLLVDLYNVEAHASRAEGGLWAVAKLLTTDVERLPLHLVERRFVEGVCVCRLTAAGLAHLNAFAGLYAALYPGVRRPLRSTHRSGGSRGRPSPGTETFSVPRHAERLVVPQPALEGFRGVVAGTKSFMTVELSSQLRLTVGPNFVAAAPVEGELPEPGPLDEGWKDPAQA
ncbi:helix-turn-helix domain-containing protein [Streptomyces sp. SID486]|uniref:helix-turn-helix transcriptional regulator n=1 Tax=unclassified Streptomyces TaxID=2593676 RepID=UPI00136BAAC3|nr:MULTISPECIES: helix-turn-helix transcriptional regulator [unclassified Streptomyces]MYW44052.1 helix-turn-helix domain-containing protein [Streptomyces sp. SID161]MYX98687.1 helix-turn-helix domain-containing protein [Streptomyces sp. SID486]